MASRLRVSVSLAVALVGSTPGVVLADGVRFGGESRSALQRFVEAAELESTGRAPAALDLYLRILDENADDLVPADRNAMHLLPARWLVHRRIARSLNLLPLFRDRIDAAARARLDEGVAARDPRLLEQLVQRWFASRPAEVALHWLGDLACERGDLTAAIRYWSLLIPSEDSGDLRFPSPTGDPALPAAKVLVARLLAGEPCSDDVAEFARRFPNAEGHLAGRSGRLAAILDELQRDPAVRIVRGPSPPPTETEAQIDFAAMPPYPPILLRQATPAPPGQVVQRPLERPSSLAFVPAIVTGHVLVADARRITAYELATGRIVAEFDLRTAVGVLPPLDLTLPSATDVRYPLTVIGDSIYARMGQPRIRADLRDSESYIVALQFRPNAAEKLRLRWVLPAARAEGGNDPVFESAPLAFNGRLFVAATRIEGNRALTSVACLDPTGSAPKMLWQRDVFEAGAETAERTRHLKLSAADSLVVCGPHAGGLIALDAASGNPAWAVRYPARDPGARVGDPSPRDWETCALGGGRVFIAPVESDRILALDAMTGAPLWEAGPFETTHLLGVADGRLIVQTGGMTAGVLALDAAHGAIIPGWGYATFGAEAAAPFGRGLIFGNRVYWPTRAAGIFITRTDGTPVFAPAVLRSAPGGHLILGDGRLIIAGADRLFVLESHDR